MSAPGEPRPSDVAAVQAAAQQAAGVWITDAGQSDLQAHQLGAAQPDPGDES